MKRDAWWLGILTVVSFGLFYYLRTPFAGDWDSYDFIWQVVTHRHSNLGFGRPYFIALHIPVWEIAHRLFDVPRTEAHQVLQLTTLALGSVTPVLFYGVLRRLLDRPAAWLGAILLMVSPFYVVYSGFIMTEIPMFFFFMSALLFHLKGLEEGKLGWIALGSAVVGIMLGVRENSLVFIPLFFLLPFIRSRNQAGHGWKVLACMVLPALLIAGAGPLWLFWRHPMSYLATVKYWLSKVPRARTQDYTLLGYLVRYMFMNAPISAVLLLPALIEMVRRRRTEAHIVRRDGPQGPPIDAPLYNATYSELLIIGFLLVGLPYMALLMDADMKYYSRYVLIGVPGMAMLAGLYINNAAARLRAGPLWKYGLAMGLGAVILLISSVPIRQRNAIEQRRRDILTHMYTVTPENAIFLPGTLTPLVEAYRQMGIRPQWEMIASGWPWPGRENLARLISDLLYTERPIYLISDVAVWRHLDQEQADINCLRDKFQFQRVDEYLVRLQRKPDMDSTEED